jgi:hypothetical protein
MNDNRIALADKNRGPEAFAAELTAAAYPVALRHGVGGKWLDLELDLWRALTETVKNWERRITQAIRSPETARSDVIGGTCASGGRSTHRMPARVVLRHA